MFHTMFIHSPIDRHLGYFQFGVMMDVMVNLICQLGYILIPKYLVKHQSRWCCKSIS